MRCHSPGAFLASDDHLVIPDGNEDDDTDRQTTTALVLTESWALEFAFTAGDQCTDPIAFLRWLGNSSTLAALDLGV